MWIRDKRTRITRRPRLRTFICKVDSEVDCSARGSQGIESCRDVVDPVCAAGMRRQRRDAYEEKCEAVKEERERYDVDGLKSSVK